MEQELSPFHLFMMYMQHSTAACLILTADLSTNKWCDAQHHLRPCLMESLSAAKPLQRWQSQLKVTGPQLPASAFLLYFLLHNDLWRQCVCTLENVEFVLIVPEWFQAQKFSLPNTAFFLWRLQRTQSITWSVTGAHHHFSPSLIAWTSLGSEHPLVVLPAHSKSLSPPYRWYKTIHRNTMVR